MSYMIDPVKPYLRPTQNFALGGAVDDTPQGTDGSDDQSDPGQNQEAIPASTGDEADQGQGSSVDNALSVVDKALSYGRQQNGLGGGQQQASAMPMIPGKQSEYPGPAPRPQPGPGPLADNSSSPRPIQPMPSRQGDRPIPKFDPRDYLPGGPGTKTSQADTTDETQSMDAGGRIQAFDAGGDVQQGSDDSTDQAGGPDQTQQGAPDQNAVGAIPDQQPAQGGDDNMIPPITPGNMQRGAQRIINYLRGGDGDQNLTNQLAKQVDPHGQMDESERNLKVVEAASEQGGDQAAWKVVQANRQAFNAKQAFARAALNGSEGKPPDIAAAAKAATQAFPHMLDGTKTEFTPTKNGVTVAVTKVGAEQPFQKTDLSVAQFNDLLNMGKTGLYDNLIENGIGPVIQQLKQQPGTPVQGQAAAGSANRPFATPGVAQPGAQQQQPAQQGEPDIDPKLERLAARLFPNVSQQAERNKYIQDRMAAQAEQSSKLEVAKNTRYYGAAATAEGKQRTAETYVAGRNYAADQRLKGVLGAAQAKSASDQDRTDASMINAEQRNVPFGTPLSPQAEAARRRLEAKFGSAPAPAAGPAPAQQPATQAAPAAPGLNIGDVKKGYRYKGGPANDKNSWEPAQ